MSDEATNGRATVGQVYEIVGRVEGKVDALTGSLNALTVTNEHRFTELETKSKDAGKRIEAIEEDVTALTTAHAVAQSHLKVAAGSVGIVVTLMAGGLGLALAHLFHW